MASRVETNRIRKAEAVDRALFLFQPGDDPGARAPEAPAASDAARVSWIVELLRRPLFLAVVVVPNLLAILYFGILASPVFTSTATLFVLNPKQSGPSLSSLLSGASGDSSEQGGYILKEYFASWDAFQSVAPSLDLETNFENGDIVSRFGGLATAFRKTDVALWRYFQGRVAVEIDQKSGIVALDVSTYDPAYANRLARALLGNAVAHMDRMNAEQERDYIKTALARKQAIEAALKADLVAIAGYRSTTGTYDPKELYLSNLALLNSLSVRATELLSQREAIAQATPNNPQAANLDVAIAAVHRDIAATASGFPAMARRSSRYDNLLVSRDNNITLLGQANLALQQAQATAEKNRYYLNVISSPSEPETAEGPPRLLWIGGVLLGSLILWGLLR